MAHSYNIDLGRYRFFRGKLLEFNEDSSYSNHTHAKLPLLGFIRCDNDGDVASLSVVECDLL